jgi:autotransporter translocation and assembly factor TamB
VRKRFKIPLFSLTFLLLVVLAVVVWVFRSGWLQRRAVAYLNQALAVATTLEVDIGTLSGNPFSELVADDVVLRTRGRASDTLAIIKRFSVQYDIAELWRRHWIIENVLVDSLRVFVPRAPLGEVLSSIVPAEPGKTPSHGGLFDFRLSSLIIRNGAVFREGSPTPIADSIHLILSADRAGEQLNVHVEQVSVDLPDVGPIAGSGSFRSISEVWAADSVIVTSAKSQISGSGGPEEWRIRTNPLDLADVTSLVKGDLTGRLALDGTVRLPRGGLGWSGQGRVTGVFEGFDLDDVAFRFSSSGDRIVFDTVDGGIARAVWHGTAWVNLGDSPPRYAYRGTTGHFDLSQFARGASETDLSGAVSVTGEGLTGSSLAMELTVSLGAGQFDHVAFDSAAGMLRATPNGVLFAQDFYVEWGATRLTGGGSIAFGDSIDVLANIACDDLRTWDSLVFIDSLAGHAEGYVYLSGLTADPDLSGRLMSDSLRLFNLRTQQFTASFFVPRFLTHPSGSVEARFGRSNAWGWAVDSIMAKAALSGRVITFDTLSWCAPQAVIEGRGWLDWSADTIPIALYPVTARILDQTLTATDTVAVVADSAGFGFSNFAVRSEWGTLQLYGRLGYDESLNMVVDVQGVPVAAVWHRFYPKIDLEGQLACVGRVRGSLALPQFDLEGRIDDLRYEGDHLGNLSGSISYGDRHLSTDGLKLEFPAYQILIAGSLPMELRLDTPTARVLEEPLSGRLTATGNSLDMVTRFLPETIESIRGTFSVSATLSGTPRMPLIRGEAFLRSATIKTVEIANPIEDVQVDLTLRQDTVEVTRAVGTVRDKKRRGQIEIGGYLRILAYNLFDYNLTLTGRNVPARFEFEDFAVETDLDLSVIGATPPTVRGRITPRSVEDREPFATEPVEAVTDTTLWNWDMTVELPGNYWLHNDQIDAELSADLRVVRDRGRPIYLGTAEFIRGKVYLYDKAGSITRGVLTFDNPNASDPSLDIDVTFRINQPRLEQTSANQGRDVIDLLLHVGGRASEPLIEPQAPYTQQDVLLLLMANTTLAGGDTTVARDPWADRLRFAATGLLFSEVQRVAARRLGLETLEITSGIDPKMTEVTVGRYVSPHLYLYGSSPLDVGAGQEVGFEYRFSRRIYLEGNRDKNNLYRFNVHFNWDY